MEEFTAERFIELKTQGLTYSELSEVFNLTERQIAIRSSKLGFNFSNTKQLDHEFFNRDTNESHYWAGFIAADGSIEKDRPRLSIGIQKGDIEHLQNFKHLICAEHDICDFMNSTAVRIRFNSSTIVTSLNKKFNITNAKTFTYKMPCILKDSLLLSFLRGYIDGDGHIELVSGTKVRMHLCSASYDFLYDYYEICQLFLGYKFNRTILKQNNLYSLAFNCDDSKKLLDMLYSNSTKETRLDRKYNTYLKSCR